MVFLSTAAVDTRTKPLREFQCIPNDICADLRKPEGVTFYLGVWRILVFESKRHSILYERFTVLVDSHAQELTNIVKQLRDVHNVRLELELGVVLSKSR